MGIVLMMILVLIMMAVVILSQALALMFVVGVVCIMVVVETLVGLMLQIIVVLVVVLVQATFCCRVGRGDVEVELFSGDNVLFVAENGKESVVKDIKNDDDYLISCEFKQIHKLKVEDIDLQPHLKYHTHALLPEDPNLAKRIVMESQHNEIIDGVLHHKSTNYPGHWCIVVPQQLRTQLLHEAHAGCFGGHFSERKVYDNYWWYGLRREILKFYH